MDNSTKYGNFKSLNKISILRSAVYFTVNRLLDKHYLQCHSEHTAKMVTRRHYSLFLDIMDSIPEIERDHDYISRKLLVELGMDPHLARCKAYKLTACENTIATCHVSVSSGSLSFFSSVLAGGLSSFSDRLSLAISDSFVALCFAPDLSGEDLLFDCGFVGDSAASVSHWLEVLKNGGRATRLGADGRSYHAISALKKEVRRLIQVGDSHPDCKIAEVDGHAAHVAILVGRFATGHERRGLIAMLQSGDFYREFGRLARVHETDVKRNFLAECIFKFRPESILWQTLLRHFPNLARRLAYFRDADEEIVRRKQKQCRDTGKLYRAKTRKGQFRLSRYLCRIEGEIFRGAQKQLYRLQNIVSAPLHDCLLCARRDAGTVAKTVERWLEQVLGFRVPVKTTK